MCFHWPVRLYFGSKYVWFYILDRFTLFMQILNVIFNLSLKRCTLFLLLLFFPSPHVVVMLCSLLSVVMQRKEKELNLDFSCYFWHTGICGVILWKKWKNFFAPLSGFLVIFFHKGDKKMHTLRRLSGLEERHSWGKVLGGGVGIFSQEVKGQGPLNQHFGPLKLSAITSQTHS